MRWKKKGFRRIKSVEPDKIPSFIPSPNHTLIMKVKNPVPCFVTVDVDLGEDEQGNHWTIKKKIQKKMLTEYHKEI